MNVKSMWNYTNKGLLALLGVLVGFSLASIFFLLFTLLHLNTLLNRSGSEIGSAFVLQDLLINVLSAESSRRGYVVTGNDHFIKDFDESVDAINRDLKIIKTNPQLDMTREQAERIEKLTQQKVAYMDEVILVRQQEGADAASAMVGTLQGDEMTHQLEQEIQKVASMRLQNIGPRQQQSQDDVRRAVWVAAAAAVFVVGTCAAVIRYFQRSILKERALENTKSEFLSLASHQLRTPATNVKQYVGMLLEGYMGDLTDQQRNALSIAYKNNESEISIMNNLLDVAKLDLNRIQLNKKPTNLVPLTKHVTNDYRSRAIEKHQTLRLIGDSEVMAFVDAGHIKGVIENLVDNAIKYSHEDSKILIKVYQTEDEAIVAVKDYGLGIRKRDYPRLFNKFSRLDNEFSASSQGSGLGLYWVKQIVALHGGRITVSSREGKGSLFKIHLPIK